MKAKPDRIRIKTITFRTGGYKDAEKGRAEFSIWKAVEELKLPVNPGKIFVTSVTLFPQN